MQQQLIIGTLLHGGTYKIEKVLGQGRLRHNLPCRAY